MSALLSASAIYNLFMRMVGYDKAMRCLVETHIRPFPGARLLDIGCGTSLILNHITADISYAGYDPNPRYIENSRKRYAHHKGYGFFCEKVTDRILETGGAPFDLAVAVSLVHHLSDAEAASLFQSARAALKPQGRFITYDPVVHGRQSRLERFIMNHDRGATIRTAAQYEALARGVFKNVRADVRTDMGWRIPATAIIMTCTRD